MIRTVFITALVFLLAGFSCKKDGLEFSGYTPVDGVGNPMGTPDNSDWTFDANWKSSEISKINSISAADLTGTTPGTITVFPAYPNPCTNVFGLAVNTSTKCGVRLILCDESLNHVWSLSQQLNPGFNNIIVAPDPARVRAPYLYRLYYVFDAEGQLVFQKGHGDVFFKK